LLIIVVLVCVLLGLIVLIQNPKGGGLASNFSSSSQLMGVQKTGDFLEKGTWVLAITLMVLSLAINVVAKTGGTTADPVTNKAVESASKPSGTGTVPPPAPAPAGLGGQKPAEAPKK
ncbi:MAG: preprotein translocase subunit SecG, partial [Sphingobacteriaceae bacterium]